MRKALSAVLDFIAGPPTNARVFILAALLGLLIAAMSGRAGGQAPADTATTRERVIVVRDSLIRADSVRDATAAATRAANMAKVDSLLAAADSLLRASKPRTAPSIWQLRLHSVFARKRATQVYAAGLSTGLALNYTLRIDSDPGGYPDSWTSPDKLYHANVAYFMTDMAMGQSVRPRWAFALTCGLAGVGWEVSQRGFISGKDIAADCLGSGLAVGMRKFRERARQ
jgi:hypothetical protein